MIRGTNFGNGAELLVRNCGTSGTGLISLERQEKEGILIKNGKINWKLKSTNKQCINI